VDRPAAESANCVSAEVAERMARGVCGLFGADVGVATTGYAEPSPEWSVTVPFAWWAVTGRQTDGTWLTRRGRIECPGATRTQAQDRVAAAAMAALLDWLSSSGR
jgi:nicotinamide-nucleotide amidase